MGLIALVGYLALPATAADLLPNCVLDTAGACPLHFAVKDGFGELGNRVLFKKWQSSAVNAAVCTE